MTHWRQKRPHMREEHIGPAIAIMFVVVIIVIGGLLSGPDDCPGGSVTASGIARCR